MLTAPLELDCRVQKYAWGKPGADSAVARLRSGYEAIDMASPYAELWMGTHPNGPSLVLNSKEPLKEVLGNSDLPFLFKVLSVNQALSIQAHPDKNLAKILHSASPIHYADDNHKPEMAVALTHFEALCGFRPVLEIAHFLNHVPQFQALVGEDCANEFIACAESGQSCKKQLRTIFSNVMTSRAEDVTRQLNSLLLEIEGSSQCRNLSLQSMPGLDLRIAIDGSRSSLNLQSLITRLAKEYPNDIGIFCVFFLNALELQPGDGLYLGANEPHAYLSGDCVEVMACSDNVVRAGLTSKYRDVATLCSMLTYNASVPEIREGCPLDEHTVEYKAPVSEFYLTKTQISAKSSILSYKLQVISSVSIIIVISGSGSLGNISFKQGTVLIIPANFEAFIRLDVDSDLVLFRCSEKPTDRI